MGAICCGAPTTTTVHLLKNQRLREDLPFCQTSEAGCPKIAHVTPRGGVMIRNWICPFDVFLHDVPDFDLSLLHTFTHPCILHILILYRHKV